MEETIIKALVNKGGLYEAKVYLPNMSRIAKQNFQTLADVKSRLLADDTLALESLLLSAFERAGAGRARYGEHAVQVLRQAAGSNLQKFLGNPNALPLCWRDFEAICNKNGVGVNERLNRGVLEGLISLAGQHGNLFNHIGKFLPGQIEQAFLELIQIKGIGEKIASFLLRDTVWVHGVEGAIHFNNRLYLQPIDRWVKRVAQSLWSDLKNESVPSWIISKRIAEACEHYKVSGIKFNQGAWYLGAIESKTVTALDRKLQSIKAGAY